MLRRAVAAASGQQSFVAEHRVISPNAAMFVTARVSAWPGRQPGALAVAAYLSKSAWRPESAVV
jgi:hypothetical protein